jgi:hypothetical protein
MHCIRRKTQIVLLACLGAALLGAAPAHAARNETVLFEAPRDLLNASTRPGALAQLQSLGVHALRIVLYWHDVAPNANSTRAPSGFDPTNPAAYHWDQYDALIGAAEQLHWPVVLTVSGPVPRWATATRRDTLTRPDPLQFERFMTAVGDHYGGYVKMISLWNEPNQPQFLLPQYVHGAPASPRIYRALWQAGYAGLRASANFAGMQVLIGETSPVGNPHVVAPLTFLRGALCLDSHYRRIAHSTCSKLPVAGYAHHAYTTAQGPFFRPADRNDVSIAQLSRLTRALDEAARAGAIPSRVPIYLTEFGIQSFPDPFEGVQQSQQAEFLGISEHIAYENPRVRFFSQYLLRDDPPIPGPPLVKWSGFQSGLETFNGRKKPAYFAWPVPLTVTRRGSRVSLWGLARPTSGATSVEVQVSDRHRAYRKLLVAHTNSLGYWTAHSSFRRGRVWRVVWTAPSGAPYTGPATRAYDRVGHDQR